MSKNNNTSLDELLAEEKFNNVEEAKLMAVGLASMAAIVLVAAIGIAFTVGIAYLIALMLS